MPRVLRLTRSDLRRLERLAKEAGTTPARVLRAVLRDGFDYNRQPMTTLDIKLSLPEPLATEAARLGLLEPESLRALLADAVRTRRLERLAEARARIAAAGIEPLSMEEIEAEIAADRAEQQRAARG